MGLGGEFKVKNFSRAAWAELRKGWLELRIPVLPFLCPCLCVYLQVFCYFSGHTTGLNVFVLTEVCLEAKFSRILEGSGKHSENRVLWSARNWVNTPKLGRETSLLYTVNWNKVENYSMGGKKLPNKLFVHLWQVCTWTLLHLMSTTGRGEQNPMFLSSSVSVCSLIPLCAACSFL